MLEPESKYFYSQGLKLHYADWGNHSAPALIFVHGMFDHARSWDFVAHELRKDWHVIALDLRGHGDSEWSPDGAYHVPYHLLDLIALIDSLGEEQVSIVAHSLGGNPSSRFAGLYPDRINKLVMVDAMGPAPAAIEMWDKQGVINRAREWVEKNLDNGKRVPRRFSSIEIAAERMSKANKMLSTEQAYHLAKYGVREYEDGFGWKYDPLAGNFSPEDFAVDLAEFWREITAPILVCWGPKGWTTNPDEDGRSQFFQNHQTVVFNHSGHWIHHDQLEEFTETIQKFLG